MEGKHYVLLEHIKVEELDVLDAEITHDGVIQLSDLDIKVKRKRKRSRTIKPKEKRRCVKKEPQKKVKKNTANRVEPNTDEEADIKVDEEMTTLNFVDSGQITLETAKTESDYFKIYLNKNIMELIVRETNNHAAYYIKNKPDVDCIKRWKDCTVDEIYTFLGVCLLMTRNSRTRCESCWSSDELLYSPIYSNTISRDRFRTLMRLLYFSSNHSDEEDRHHKIRPLIDEFKNIDEDCVYPYDTFCLDKDCNIFKKYNWHNEDQEDDAPTILHTQEFCKYLYKGGKKEVRRKASSYQKGFLDNNDLFMSCLNFFKRGINWYKKAFFYLVDLSMVNSHSVYLSSTGKKTLLGDYQLEVIRQLIYTHAAKDSLQMGKSHEPRKSSHHRLTGRHFLMSEPNLHPKKVSHSRQCYVCSHTKLAPKKRKTTIYLCKQCNIPMCATGCFEAYHTKEDF